jgi:predicted DCC family thiol-disulfide oxidoreductase YuxK
LPEVASDLGTVPPRVTPVKTDGPIGRLHSGTWFEERYCRADLRWLGVFRILLGLLLCAELLRRWVVATDFYTNDGVLPNHFSLFRPLGRRVFSIYHAFSTLPEVNVAFALTLLVFLTFTLGYRTRLFHFLSLICITSLNARNLLVENGGTVVVNLLCFWTIFFPLGRRLSLDALSRSLATDVEQQSADLNRRASVPDEAHSYYSLIVVSLLIQWSAIYFFNVVHKTGVGWHDGSALHWFLQQDRIVTWFGVFARNHAPEWLLQGFTYATLAVEGTLAVALLIPFKQIWFRRLALLLAIGLHGGIAATSRLGPFSYAMTIFFVWTLSPIDWAWLKRHVVRKSPPLTVIFDADCGFCFQTCRVLKRLDLWQKLRFVGNDELDQIPPELGSDVLEQTVVVIDARGRILVRERAVSAILSALPFWSLGLGLVLRLPGIAQLARRAYDVLARHRQDVSTYLGLGACGLERPRSAVSVPALQTSAPAERLWPNVLHSLRIAVRESLVVIVLVMICIQLLTENDWARRRVTVTQPAALLAVVDIFRLYQGWKMFAPEPPYEDGRLVVDARTQDGRKVDPLSEGAEPDFNPETPVGWGQSQLWCDYHLKMYFARYAPNRQHLEDYLRNWHKRTGRAQDRLVAFDVWWVSDKSPPPGVLHGQPQKPILLLSWGEVTDSGAEPWLKLGEPVSAQR